MTTIRKCLFPAAGYGTRFLPATKSMPKEMLPVVDKPLIQYGVEEAMDAGMNNIGIVTGRGKRALADHFDVSYELEHQISGSSKEGLLKIEPYIYQNKIRHVFIDTETTDLCPINDDIVLIQIHAGNRTYIINTVRIGIGKEIGHFYSGIRKIYSSEVLVNFTIEKANNDITLVLTDQQTDTLKPGKYQYDVIMQKTTGELSKIVEGLVIVVDTITEVP